MGTVLTSLRTWGGGGNDDNEEGSGGGEHYSKTHTVHGVYGVKGLYVDQISANDDIQIVIVR